MKIKNGKSILEILTVTKDIAQKGNYKNWAIWVEDLSTGFIYKIQNVADGDLRQKSFSRQNKEDKGTNLTSDIGVISEFSDKLTLLPNYDNYFWRLIYDYNTKKSYKWLVPKEVINNGKQKIK